MKFFGRKLSFSRLFKNESSTTLANPAEWLVQELLGRMAASGVAVSPLRALGISTVFACTNVVSRTMSSVPFKLKRRLPEGGAVDATEHRLYDLVGSVPNKDMTSATFVRTMQANATLRNYAYALIVRNGLDEIVELWPIEPCDLKICRNKITKDIEYWVEGKKVDDRSILPVRGMTFDGVCNFPMITAIRDCVGLAIALQDNASKYFANGSRPGAILEHPSALSEEALERLRKQIDEHKGSEQAYKTMILEEGLKFAQSRDSNESAQFDQSRLAQDKAICRFFGVSPHKVQILDDAHYNNVEQENINYVTDSILPWAIEWEQSCNKQLLTPEERRTYYFKFNLSGLVRGDLKTRYEAYAKAREWGWYSADEIREFEELGPIPNGKGKIFLQPANSVEAGTPPPVKATPKPPTE